MTSHYCCYKLTAWQTQLNPRRLSRLPRKELGVLVKGSAGATRECSLRGTLATFWSFYFTSLHSRGDGIGQQYLCIGVTSSSWASLGFRWWKLVRKDIPLVRFIQVLGDFSVLSNILTCSVTFKCVGSLRQIIKWCRGHYSWTLSSVSWKLPQTGLQTFSDSS